MNHENFHCPICQGKLILKYEAKYVYSYVLDMNVPGTKNTDEFLPYLYDSREQTESVQYIECETCGTRQPCIFSLNKNQIDAIHLQDVISAMKG